MSELTTDPQYLEMVMAKALTEDKDFVVTVTQVFEDIYFDSPDVQELFKFTRDYFAEYKQIPDRSIVMNSIPVANRASLEAYLHHIDNTDINIPNNRDWLMAQTDLYLRDKAIKDAVRKSVEVIDQRQNTHDIRKLVEAALCRTINIDLGLNYFADLNTRLPRMMTDENQRLKTYFPAFDEFINGGFPPKTLSVFVAKIHGFKCLSYNSYIHIQEDGFVRQIQIGEFCEKYINTYNNVFTGETQMPSLQSFINKHGESAGKKRYEEWRENISKPKSKTPQKGVSKLDLFVNKYGQDDGAKKYESWLEKNRENGKKGKGRGTLEWYVAKYGEVEGTIKHKKLCQTLQNSNKGINTIEWYVEKYGEVEGTRRYEEKNLRISDKGRGTLEWFVEKYGEVEGRERHVLYIDRQKFSHSEDGYIEKHGEEEGGRLWQERMHHLKHTTSLEGFVMRHGKEKGLVRWKERQKKWMKSYKKSNFSKVSQEMFWEIANNINDLSDTYFAELGEDKKEDKTGRNHEYNLDLGDSFAKPDFIKGNKIIEFDGDYWHGEARGNQERDRLRDEKLTSLGYEVLRVKERDWKQDQESVIKECLEFING